MRMLRRAFSYQQSRFYQVHIEKQLWSTYFSPLDNSIADSLTDDKKLNRGSRKEFLRNAVSEDDSRFFFFWQGKIAVEFPEKKIVWRNYRTLIKLGLKLYEIMDHVEEGDTVFVVLGKRKSEAALGRDEVLNASGWRFVVDVSHLSDQDLFAELESFMEDKKSSEIKFLHPRSLLPLLDKESLSVVGQAVARLNWHQEVAYASRSGRKAYPAGGGHRREDILEKNSNLAVTYPRTDPVAIMLVESSDGKRCILGRTKRRHQSNMYSCLAGFIEQGESVEDAVRREVFEESGIHVQEDIRIVGTQSWPIGAAGHSELMIGCIAKAVSDEIVINEDEMDDVKWFTKSQALQLISNSLQREPVGKTTEKPLTVPPPYAIAHHLIKAWAEREEASVSMVKLYTWVVSAAAGGVVLGLLLSKL